MKVKKEPNLPDNPSKGRIQPPVVRKKALTLYSQGHAVPDIARAIGVHSATVRRWCRQTGTVHGSALAEAPEPQRPEDILKLKEEDPDEIVLAGELEPSPVQRLMNAEQVMGAIDEALSQPGDTANKYQAIMVALGMNMLKTATAMPPAVKTVKDLATLNDIIRTNLGLNAKGSGSGSLSINLNVLTKAVQKAGNVSVEAEVIDDEE